MGRQTQFVVVPTGDSEFDRFQHRLAEALRVTRQSPQALLTAKGSIVAATGDGQPVEHKVSATDGLPLLTDSTQTNGLNYAALSLAAAVTGVLPIANGGTNSSTALTNGKVMIASGSKIVEGPAGTATTVLHGNASGNPTYSGVSLANDTAANQGTTTTLLHGNAAGQPAFSGVALADFVANLGTATTVLHGNAAGQPTYGAVSLTADVSGTLPEGNGGTNQSTYAQGDILYASASNTLAKLAKGTSGQLLSIGATIPAWLGDTAWTNVSGGVGFANSWADTGAPKQSAGYFKGPDGFIHIRGNIKSGTIAATAFTLPSGYRPSATMDFPAIDGVGAVTFIEIASAGTVKVMQGSNLGCTLDGITFDTR